MLGLSIKKRMYEVLKLGVVNQHKKCLFYFFKSCLFINVDAGGGDVCGVGEDHAGLSNARNVQTFDGRVGPLHVPARHARTRTHSR